MACRRAAPWLAAHQASPSVTAQTNRRAGSSRSKDSPRASRGFKRSPMSASQVPPGALNHLLGVRLRQDQLMRSIAGFVTPDRGRITIDGSDLLSLPPEKRSTAMLFQNYGLFPHMTVAANVGFGLRIARRAEGRSRAARGGRASPDAHRRTGRPLSGTALRRPTAKGRARTCSGHPSRHPVARRAVSAHSTRACASRCRSSCASCSSLSHHDARRHARSAPRPSRSRI